MNIGKSYISCFLLFCFLLFVLFVPTLAYAEPGWKWVGGDASPSGWVTVHGLADVNINGGQLNAKLYEADGVTLAQTLKGSINSGKVTIVRRVHDSDVGDETMRGTYAKQRHADSVGEAIIVQTQWGFAAITRTLQK